MNEEIKQLILAEIDKAHEHDNLRGIAANRDRLVSDLLAKRRYELRRGKITNPDGVLQNLADDVELLIDASPYIGRRRDAAERAKYVSKFNKPSAETRKAYADEMENVLKKLSKLHSIVPKDQDNYERALRTIAAHFLYETDENGQVRFAKLSDSGLLSERRFTFEDLKNGIAHLIDSEKTSFAQGLRESELRSLAMKFFDIPNPKKEYIEDKIKMVKKNELASTIPAKRLPQIPRSEVEKEVMRRTCAISGLGDLSKVVAGGGMPLAKLQRIAKREYDSLSDTTEIESQLKSIQPRGPQQYEGISYE